MVFLNGPQDAATHRPARGYDETLEKRHRTCPENSTRRPVAAKRGNAGPVFYIFPIVIPDKDLRVTVAEMTIISGWVVRILQGLRVRDRDAHVPGGGRARWEGWNRCNSCHSPHSLAGHRTESLCHQLWFICLASQSRSECCENSVRSLDHPDDSTKCQSRRAESSLACTESGGFAKQSSGVRTRTRLPCTQGSQPPAAVVEGTCATEASLRAFHSRML